MPIEKNFPFVDELNNLNDKIMRITFRQHKNEKENPVIEEIKK